MTSWSQSWRRVQLLVHSGGFVPHCTGGNSVFAPHRQLSSSNETCGHEWQLPRWQRSSHLQNDVVVFGILQHDYKLAFSVLVPVQSAAHDPPADEGADVVDLDAAHLVALVPSAAPFLRAPFLAARVVRARIHLGARDLPVHEAAAATHFCERDKLEIETVPK